MIGNPYSLILGHEEKIKGPTEGSPIAVKTKLGTCVSGNLASQALQEDQTSHTTTATEVNPAPARRILTSIANPEAKPSPHVTLNGKVSTPEAKPSPHVTPNGNVSTSEAVPSPQVTVSGNVSNSKAAPSPNVTTNGNVSKTTPSLHAATNSNVLTTADAAATTEETSIAKTQSSTYQGVWSLPIPREPRESVTLQGQANQKPDTVTSAKCQSLRAQKLDGNLSNTKYGVVHSSSEALTHPSDPSSITVPATEPFCDFCFTGGYEGQPASFARLADEQLIRWMTLDQIALHPRDYPGIDEDINQEEFECRQKILDSLIFMKNKNSTLLPFLGEVWTVLQPTRMLPMPSKAKPGTGSSAKTQNFSSTTSKPSKTVMNGVTLLKCPRRI